MSMEEFCKTKLKFINNNKEKLIEAWVAETGFLPSESVLMQQDTPNGGVKMWVEKKYGDLPKNNYSKMDKLLAVAEIAKHDLGCHRVSNEMEKALEELEKE